MCVPKARELHSQLLLIQLNSNLSQIPVTVLTNPLSAVYTRDGEVLHTATVLLF